MSIVRVRRSPGGFDAYGDPVASTETRTTIDDAYVAPRTSDELTDRGRTGVVVGLSLFVPYGTDIDPHDSFEVDGVAYRVEGEAGDWQNPFTGWEAGTTVALERVEG